MLGRGCARRCGYGYGFGGGVERGGVALNEGYGVFVGYEMVLDGSKELGVDISFAYLYISQPALGSGVILLVKSRTLLSGICPGTIAVWSQYSSASYFNGQRQPTSYRCQIPVVVCCR